VKTHPIFARAYERFASGAEKRGQAEFRRRALAGLSGRVLELGAGNGLNFAHYPGSVAEVIAVEPEPYLRERASERAREAAVPVSVIEGEADALPVGDASVDAAVASLVLCSVPDQARALAELRRVLKPGGELRVYEHVISHKPRKAAFQRWFTRTLWKRMAGGCHMDRDTAGALRAAGFEGVDTLERVPFQGLAHLLGVVRAPQG
jgi:ubiquinone/menaquinone biosynthesis C-methylase UbiE